MHYDRPEIEEIVINGPGVVHYRLRQNDAMGRWWREVHDANLTYEYLVTVIHAVANTFGHCVGSRNNPQLHGSAAQRAPVHGSRRKIDSI